MSFCKPRSFAGFGGQFRSFMNFLIPLRFNRQGVYHLAVRTTRGFDPLAGRETKAVDLSLLAPQRKGFLSCVVQDDSFT